MEEKVGQLLIVHFKGDTLNTEAERLLSEGFVGGIIYYNIANRLDSPQQVQKLSQGLQECAQQKGLPPLWICVDQEYGKVARLREGFTPFPGNRALAQSQRVDLAQGWAKAIGEELRAVGVNVNLAPVIDVSFHPETSFITARAFGDTPEIVIAYAKPALEGYKQAGILAVPKHFPGYGSVALDPHQGLPWVNKSAEELESQDLKPFIELSTHADAFMTAHIMVPALDASHCATLSKKILGGCLRQKMNFQGLVFTDSLTMEGVLKNTGTVEEAAILAVEAGCDHLIIGLKQLDSILAEEGLRVHQAIVAAVRDGRISMATIDAAFERILHYKRKYGLFNRL